MERVIEEMSLEEKLGQMFMSTCENDFVTGNLINLITMYHIGGILLTSPNLHKKNRLNHLNQYLQFYATNKRPLIIASKQDAKKYDDLVVMPEVQALQEVNNRLYTKQLAEVIAAEHRAVGINTIIYPKLDVNKEKNFDLVAHHAVAVVQGMKKSYVANCVSGFPKWMEINIDIKPDSRKSNVYPFYRIVKEDIGIIMVEEIEELLINDYLRNTLGFANVIMYEITEPFSSVQSIAEIIIKAIHAGVNMIILPYTYKEQIALLNYLLEIGKQGKIDQTKIDDSLNKILTLKKTYQMNELMNEDELKIKDHYVKQVKEKINVKMAQIQME